MLLRWKGKVPMVTGDWGKHLPVLGPETAIVVTKGSGGLHGGGGRGLETGGGSGGSNSDGGLASESGREADGGSDHLGRIVELVVCNVLGEGWEWIKKLGGYKVKGLWGRKQAR